MTPLTLFMQQGPGGRDAADMRTLYVHNLVTDAAIGVYHTEKGRRQKIVIDMAVQIEPPAGPVNDDLANVIDYSLLRQAAKEMAGGPHVHLQETLCEQLVDFCLTLPGVRAAYARIGKLEAFEDCSAIGCEILRFKPLPGRAAGDTG